MIKCRWRAAPGAQLSLLEERPELVPDFAALLKLGDPAR
jgi:hypothetical protein